WKGGIELTPLVLWRSSVPFDITTGRDANGDSLFNDRPAFATDMSRPSVVVTRFGAFDLSPLPGQRIIPRNYRTSPTFFRENLGVGKKIALTKKKARLFSFKVTNFSTHPNRGLPVGILGSPFFGKSDISAGVFVFGSNKSGNRRFDALLHFSF